MMPAQDLTSRELLDFYMEAGADALVGEAPVDRFAAVDEPAPARIARAPLPAAATVDNARPNPAIQPAAPQATDEAIMAAREAAKGASSLEELRAILDKFDALTNSITEGLPREIELRQKQYEYYREKLLNFKVIET